MIQKVFTQQVRRTLNIKKLQQYLKKEISSENSVYDDEVVWIVDQNDNELGSTHMQDVYDNYLTQRVSYIFLKNNENKYWVHKRSKQQQWCPGHFDVAFGGVIGYQESYKENAQRELEEEAGLQCEITEKFKMYFECDTYKNFGMVYTANSDGPLTIQESEVDSVHLMDYDEIIKLSSDPLNKFAPDTLQALKQLHEKIDKGEFKY